MSVSFMITNHGEHSAETWAELTTKNIVDLIEIRDNSESRQADIARRVKLELQLKLFDIFSAHHGAVMANEKSELVKDARKRIKHAENHGFQPHEHLPSVMDDVNAVLAATPFDAHFAQESVQTVLRNIIGQHSADVMHHEHRYHHDRAALAAAKGA